MKNQYFGDINDYRKYGLLRVLSNEGAIRIAVCWMLTEGDGRGDGNKISYLNNPKRWRMFDPELFDVLHKSIHKKNYRNVKTVERGNLISSSVYFPQLLTDEKAHREKYFSNLLSATSGIDLVFFDPDNGIEVPSIKYGKRDSCKYIYWNEIKTFFNAGHSLLLYQHFPRVERTLFIRRKIEELQSHLNIKTVIAMKTPTVVYFLVPQQRHVKYFQQRIEVVKNKWANCNSNLF